MMGPQTRITQINADYTDEKALLPEQSPQVKTAQPGILKRS